MSMNTYTPTTPQEIFPLARYPPSGSSETGAYAEDVTPPELADVNAPEVSPLARISSCESEGGFGGGAASPDHSDGAV